MSYFNQFNVLCLSCLTIMTCGFADENSSFTWPEPTAPYKETDPFIPSTESSNQYEDIKEEDSSIEDQENDLFNLEEERDFKGMEQPVKEVPTEADPMLRTPLENKGLNDTILDQDLLDEDRDTDPVLPE